MVKRLYVEKRPGLSPEVNQLEKDITEFLGISGLKSLRILNRYDVEGIDDKTFDHATNIVFSDPAVDQVYSDLPEITEDEKIVAIEVLPGQFDQRADSAAQCIQLLSGDIRPLVNYAKIYILKGDIKDLDIQKIKDYLINPVESREASLEKAQTLKQELKIPERVETLDGFINLDSKQLGELRESLGLAMDLDDLEFLQNYFKNEEQRNPTISEVRIIDTYWSDHCRHTTFGTHLDNIEIKDELVQNAFNNYIDLREEVYGENAQNRPITLMDIATIGAKALKKRGVLPELDESEEINACSIKIPVEVNGEIQDWVVMFKNETHNHPTEIEPFGGAATCIGGCIRDPLSGRSYVYQAMRLTGGADPRADFKDTIEGKLPQRKIAQTAAEGYSSYGNQIGLATDQVVELYHPGYAAKHLECGVVVGAAPFENIRRERPEPGDVIILLGGRTGRDGIGGATGSSKSHNLSSLTTMASEVQKGNAPEERKLQRLFRNPEVTRLIKRCNDFGAGGVAVAIGELADGLKIDLDKVRKKYKGLDGTELAISESQERMAVVIAKEDVDKFIEYAEAENLEAYPVAEVTENPRLVMEWEGERICDLSRDFLNSNGAVKHADVLIDKYKHEKSKVKKPSLKEIASNLKTASRRGLVERFDGSIGAGSIFMPFGGKYQRTPEQVMAGLLPVGTGQTTDLATLMSFGFDPDWVNEWQSENVSLYQKAYNSVLNSITKLVAAGADYRDIYLSMQEFFQRMNEDPKVWALPFEALLGALSAQLDYESAAIGGKDSMSGSFLDLNVPPTLISFSLAPVKADHIISSAFKETDKPVYLFGLGNTPEKIKKSWDYYLKLVDENKVLSARALEVNGISEAVIQMSFGNKIGFTKDIESEEFWFSPNPSVIVAELKDKIDNKLALYIGKTTSESNITIDNDSETIDNLLEENESVLEDVYPTKVESDESVNRIIYKVEEQAKGKEVVHPKMIIPVFPGTNCEYDSAKIAFEAGIEPEIVVINNQTKESLKESAKKLKEKIDEAQILFIPGGFSGGDEPEGSGKFIASFLRNPEIAESVTKLLDERNGLILGICNGFQALLKLGLLPYGKITDITEDSPTLTYNSIGRHQSKIVGTKLSSNKSPWLKYADFDTIYNVPISHGEGRFIANDEVLNELIKNGQIATQYVDLEGNPSMDTSFNPNGSVLAIEGITSKDGRILGKMGHSERTGNNLYQNIPGEYDMNLFKSAFEYFN